MRVFSCWYGYAILLLLFIHVIDFVSARRMPIMPNVPIRGGSGGSQRSQRKRTDGKPKKTYRTSPSASRTNGEKISMASSLSSLSTGRRACGLYIWDAPSALFHRWTNHLLRDCVYEGLGGRKFVRIAPGSILQLLYPGSSRYSPDRCIFCGGSFPDHLTLWWSKNMYTPFDLLLDKVYKQGVVVVQNQEDNDDHGQTRRGKIAGSAGSQPEEGQKTDYLYHRRYVTEADELVDFHKKIKREKKWATKKYAAQAANHPLLLTDSPLEKKYVQLGGNHKLQYVIPSPKFQGDNKVLGDGMNLVRDIVLNAVDTLIRLENYEKRGAATQDPSPSLF
jgi:hypothetical protein